MPSKTATRKLVPLSLAFSLFGVLLFVFFVRRAGLSGILDNLRSLGFGFLLILLLAGLRLVIRTLCWTRCFEAPHKVPFRDALRAYLIGDAVGNLMPLGIVVSEPVKALMVRGQTPLVAALSAVAVENIFYSLSVALFIVTGTAALLLSFPLPHALRVVSFATLAAISVIILIAYFIISRQWRLASLLFNRLSKRRFFADRREQIAHLEEGIYGFYAR
ncbi:MAG TPA: lysylphosphatidylglycerol synthase domain-containing protein, partial [Pyrinomonadaceae bacterium]|nr:lysylphosphatidylglycerol synthase domain-containing protein [Pyrinomonadaceae bacterium]